MPWADAHAERRIALVIGNAAYKEAPLANPVNDARSIAAKLAQLGYQVDKRENLDLRQMTRAVTDFGEAVHRNGGHALFYFAGHGMQVDGRNYLIPVDAKIANERSVISEAVDIEIVTRQLDQSGKGISIVVLDACRDNPFERRVPGGGASRGLALINAPSGTLIAYATAPGKVAADGAGSNGIYTGELLKVMDEPGLRVEDMFKRARAGVEERTGGMQIPWETSSIKGDFYFVAKNATVASLGNSVPVVGVDERQIEIAAWQSLGTNPTTSVLKAFLKQFPGGAYAGLAKAKLDDVRAAKAEETRLVAAEADRARLEAERQRLAAQAELARLETERTKTAVEKAESQRLAAEAEQARLEAERKKIAFEKAESQRRVALAEQLRLETERQRKAAAAEDARREGDGKKAASAGKIQLAALVPAAPATGPTPLRPAVGIFPAAPEVPEPGSVFRDCPNCPDMAAVPVGSFTMGADPGEEQREEVPEPLRGRSQPQRRVTIAKSFALGQGHVTRGEYAAFVADTGRATPDSCYIYQNNKWQSVTGRSWRNPGFEQTDRHPVVCVSWDDAQAYAHWLSLKTGKPYRLASEAEWEYAARAGSSTARYWGNDRDLACKYANVADKTAAKQLSWPKSTAYIFPCSDGYVYTSPVGSFEANDFELHDMLGNAWQWTDDCWNANYEGAPSNGAVWNSGDCKSRVLRGGSWFDVPRSVRAADRGRYDAEDRSSYIGFRVARSF